MTQVFIYQHDSRINPQQLKNLRRHGIVPVGVRNAHCSSVRLLEVETVAPAIPADALTRAAIEALAGDRFSEAKSDFVNRLAAAMQEQPS